MKNRLKLISIAIIFIGIVACSLIPFRNKKIIDVSKRDYLVEKYNLLNFPNETGRVFLNLDEFFDGNMDPNSIAPNLVNKPPLSTYYKTLKEIDKDTNIVASLIELKDIMIYDWNNGHENWFYSDVVYFIGDITLEEIEIRSMDLLPDKPFYVEDKLIYSLNENFKDKKIVAVWWD